MSYNSKYTGQQVEAALDLAKTALQSEQYKGTVTSVTAGEGLEGGTIEDSGTISLAKKTQNDTYIDLMSKFDILEIGNTSSDTNVTIDNTSYVWMDKMLYFDKFGRLDSIEGYYYYPTKVTFGEATTSLKGLMSASDKAKLNDTVTGVKINGTTKNPSSGVVDLGTVITEHQDISGKVDKVTGKQLSTEDFTTALKQKLEGLNNYNDTEIQAAVSSLQTQLNTLVSGNANDAINSFNEIIAFLDGIKDNQDLSSIIASIEQQIASKMDKVTLANVATSGSYNDLKDKPTIPSAVTESTVSGWGFTKNTGTYSKPSTGIPKSDLASAVQTSLGKADTALQSVPSEYVTETELTGKGYATNTTLQNAMKSTEMKLSELELSLDGKQSVLVSGTNIKTINGTSILGSGNIVIEGGSGGGSLEDNRYFTDFTVETIIMHCETFSTISNDASALVDAAKNQKVICVPYQDYNNGFAIVQYKGDDSYITFTMQVDNTIYMFSSHKYDEGTRLIGSGINHLSTKIESVSASDGEAYIEAFDNIVYILNGDIAYLCCSIADTPCIGSTIRFLTRNDFTLEMHDVLWANGVIPTIEPNTFYELSITSNFFGQMLAVLTPFKPVES